MHQLLCVVYKDLYSCGEAQKLGKCSPAETVRKTAEIRLSLKIWSDLSGNLWDWKIKPAQKCKQSCSSWSGHFYSGNKHSFGLKSLFSPSLWLKPLRHPITVEIDPTPSKPRHEQAVKKMDGWQTVKMYVLWAVDRWVPPRQLVSEIGLSTA